MNVFLDTSVVLRRLLNEPHPIALWGKWAAGYASRIWLTEALRTVDRLRLDGRLTDGDVARLHDALRRVDDSLTIVPVDEDVLTRAGETFPTALGTLDSIHLASALKVRDRFKVDRFLTHDRQLALAAISMGFSVDGV